MIRNTTTHSFAIAALLALGASSPIAIAQATTSPEAGSGRDGRPAPASQRVDADLDAWWQHAVFYEVFVRSFADSTTGPLAGDGVGDLRGLIENLDYLNDGNPETDEDLGITALWLMPIAESDSYHGYDTIDYRRIDPRYGTNEDFVELIEACHERGIRVTVDLVLNHCADEHPWFVASASGDPDKRDWFIWRDEDPGWRGPWNQQVWHQGPGARPGYYYGLFHDGMPDLNYEHPPVSEEMLGVTRFWIEQLGADGFRLDAVRHLIEDGQVQDNTPATHAWLADFYRFVKGIDPETLLVGEVWAPSVDVSRYVGDQMDLAFEFWLSDAMLQSVRERRAKPVLDRLGVVGEHYPLGMYATFLRNHDQPRVVTALEGDRDGARLAAAIQFALPGVPYIYYGEEIGMTGDKPDPQIRTPMQWTGRAPGVGFTSGDPWIDPKPDARDVNVRTLAVDPGSLLSFYRRLIRARLEHEALRTGRVTVLDSGDPRVLALVRDRPDGAVLCVFNLGDDPIEGLQLDTVPLAELGIDGRATLGHDLLEGGPGGTVALPVRTLPARSGAYYPIHR